MSEKNIRVCDNERCGKEIRVPYMSLTIHSHHTTEIDLCMNCYDTFCRWLNPNQVAPGRDGSEIENV